MAEKSELEKWNQLYFNLRNPCQAFDKWRTSIGGMPIICQFEHYPGLQHQGGKYNNSFGGVHLLASSGKPILDVLKFRLSGHRVEVGAESGRENESVSNPAYTKLWLPSKNSGFCLATLELFGTYSTEEGGYRPERVPRSIQEKITDPIWENIGKIR